MRRFQDKGESFDHFHEKRIVACPKCSKPVDFINLRVTCSNCGFHKEFEPMDSWYAYAPITIELVDFLKISCCGKTFWAKNLEHLDFLESYVQATLRERTPNANRSLASRIPQWMKAKKNREEILRCISKLRIKLTKGGYSSRELE